jgi:hypothetical protein
MIVTNTLGFSTVSSNGWNVNRSPWGSTWTIYERPAWPAEAIPTHHVSRRERRLRDALDREGASKLRARLRREEADRRARSDVVSRQRAAPATGAPTAGQRLQTQDDALAARMAARRAA